MQAAKDTFLRTLADKMGGGESGARMGAQWTVRRAQR